VLNTVLEFTYPRIHWEG